MKVKIFRKPNKLQNEGWEINKYRMIVICIFAMVTKSLWYLSIKLCVFYPKDLEGGTNTLNEVTEDFLSHINWQELRKVTKFFFSTHYQAGLEGSNWGLSCRLPLPPLTCSSCCMSGRHWCGPLCHHAAHCKVIHEENIYH